jgi:hypothetical protein
MAKQQARVGRTRRPRALEPAATAQEALAALIREKQAGITDGAIQVVIAIASVTTLVTVDTTQDPPAFDPDDLGSLTFSDPRVGLTDEGVAIFKANLKMLLPQIADDIDQIPDNADLNIGDVAKFIQLSLQTA